MGPDKIERMARQLLRLLEAKRRLLQDAIEDLETEREFMERLRNRIQKIREGLKPKP